MSRIFLLLHQSGLQVFEFWSHIANYQSNLALTIINYFAAGSISKAQHHFSKDFNISHKDRHTASLVYLSFAFAALISLTDLRSLRIFQFITILLKVVIHGPS
jgi:hypothetical protein